MIDNIIDNWIKVCITLFIIFCFCLGFSTCLNSIDKYYNQKPSVTNIQYKKDSIKLNINNLEEIKDVEVIKVRVLNNDSTLELFYELVKE